MHAAKSLKDVYEDLQMFRGSVNDRFNAYFGQFREAAREFFESLDALRTSDLPSLRFEALVQIKAKSESVQERMHRRIYDEVTRGELSEVEISTLLNVNREVFVANHNTVLALADALLDIDSARDFASIPAAR